MVTGAHRRRRTTPHSPRSPNALSANLRTWLPFVLAAVCLAATTWTGAILTWVLLLAAIALILDGATLLWSRGGGLTQNRQ